MSKDRYQSGQSREAQRAAKRREKLAATNSGIPPVNDGITRRQASQRIALAVTGLLATGGMAFLGWSLRESSNDSHGDGAVDLTTMPYSIEGVDEGTLPQIFQAYPQLREYLPRHTTEAYGFTPKDGIHTSVFNLTNNRNLDKRNLVGLSNFYVGIAEQGKKGKTYSVTDTQLGKVTLEVSPIAASRRTLVLLPYDAPHSNAVPNTSTVHFEPDIYPDKENIHMSFVFVPDSQQLPVGDSFSSSLSGLATEIAQQIVKARYKGHGGKADSARAQEAFANGYGKAIFYKKVGFSYKAYTKQVAAEDKGYVQATKSWINPLILSEDDYKALPDFSKLISRFPAEEVAIFTATTPRQTI